MVCTRYPLSCEHPLYLSKKLTGDGSQRTVREQHTNYTNIVFANKMFTSVYTALCACKYILRDPKLTVCDHRQI